MTEIPIPFITALMLLLLAASNHRQLKQTSTGRLFELFLYVNVVSMLCIGFRWSHDLIWLLPVVAALAVSSAALLYLAFCSLGRTGPVIKLSRDWPHLIPLMFIVVFLFIQPRGIEIILVVTKLVYTGLLLHLARQAPTSLQLVRLSWFSNSQKALWAAAALLLISVVVDVSIAVDFMLYDGQHSAKLVGVVNFVQVLLLGWASVLAGQGKTVSAGSDNDGQPKIDDGFNTTAEDPSKADALLLQQLNELLVNQRLYADTELNLQKLARKAGVPARTVSRAINSQANKNVSQWINSARVNAVCELLEDNEVSVTQAMFEAGFLTKSNFNREFRRFERL